MGNLYEIKLIDTSINLIETKIGNTLIKKEYYINRIDLSSIINGITFNIPNFCETSSTLLFTIDSNIKDTSRNFIYISKQHYTWCDPSLNIITDISYQLSPIFDISFNITGTTLNCYYDFSGNPTNYDITSKFIITSLIN